MDKKINISLGVSKKWFTFVELMVSILISTILLWGIFFFLSDAILWISRASAQSRFLKDFYSFTTILDTWNLQILKDFPETAGFDVAMLTSFDNQTGIIIWVIDKNTKQLSGTGSYYLYHESILWYRSLSPGEISAIGLNPEVIYDYTFQGDKFFPNFNIKEFQLQMFNSGSTMDMILWIFPVYYERLEWESWSTLPQDELFQYSLTF